MTNNNAERQLPSEAAMNLLANPSFRNGVDFGAAGNGGQIIIARGFHDGGEQQQRIILHPGGPPSAPPAQPHHHQQQQQLSPVFVMAPSSSQSQSSSTQRMRNLNVLQPPPPTMKGSSPSLPSFGGSLERLNSNGLRSPLLQNKISRTPLPVIGGKFI